MDEISNLPSGMPSLTATIRHLRAFLAVTRHRSFTRAALDLHISQPSLTMAVRQLEDIVGASLFDRTTRTVALTPEGRDFVPIAERLIFDFDLALADVRATATRRRGRIGIALVHSVATKIMPFVLTKFAADNPGIRTQLREGNSSDVRQRVQRNEVDIGFASKDEDDAELDFKFLFRDQMGLLMRNDHVLARKRGPIVWADLAGHDVIGVTEDTSTRPILSQIPDLPSSVTAPRFEISMNSMLGALLHQGIGVTPAPAVSLFGETGPLIFKPLAQPTMWRSIYTVTRRGRASTPASRDIIALVKRRVAEMASQNPMVSLSQSIDR